MVMHETTDWKGHGSLKSYLIGFFSCLVFTLTAYYLTLTKLLPKWDLITILMALAFIQAFTQLYFFLDLGREHKPKWNLLVFFFMGMVVTIILLGSLWIMYNLDERLM
jgi:cytochrome o ubiquinol oxidase operon protein cyoD